MFDNGLLLLEKSKTENKKKKKLKFILWKLLQRYIGYCFLGLIFTIILEWTILNDSFCHNYS